MSLLASYGFSGSGSVVTDESGNAHDGALEGDAIRGTGHTGGSVGMGAGPVVGSGVRIPRTAALEPTTALTLEAWVKYEGSGAQYRSVVCKDRTGTSPSYQLWSCYDAEGVPHFELTTTAGNVNVAAPTAALVGGAWHHVAGTWDGSTMRLYVDAVEVATGTLGGTIIYDTAQDLFLLNGDYWTSEQHIGQIDDVRVYSHALSAAEVSSDKDTPLMGSALSVTAGADQTLYTGQVAALSASATGGTGTKVYSWSKVSGPSGAFSAASSASTNFTPSAAGTYNLRISVTDDTGSATDDVQLTVNTPSSQATVASVTSEASWSRTPSSGATSTQILSDSLGSTYLTTAANPSAQVLEVVLQPINPPAAGVDLVVTVKMDRLDSSSGTVDAYLYEGATLRSTVTGIAIPAGTTGTDVTGTVTVTFPSADLSAVTSWLTGVSVRLAVTAAV